MSELNREEAYRWLKANWKHLAQKGELPRALSRYFQKYYNQDKENIHLMVVEKTLEKIGESKPAKDEGYNLFTNPIT